MHRFQIAPKCPVDKQRANQNLITLSPLCAIPFPLPRHPSVCHIMKIAANIPRNPAIETSFPRLAAAFFVAVGEAEEPVTVPAAVAETPPDVAPGAVVAAEADVTKVLEGIAVACGVAVEIQPSMHCSYALFSAAVPLP